MKQKLRILLLVSLFVGQFANAQFENNQKDIIDVLNYNFQIEIADSTNSISVKAQERILLLTKVDYIFLQLKNKNSEGLGMQISSLKNKFGVALGYTHQNDTITIFNPGNWQLNDTLQIEISYSGVPKDGLYIKDNRFGKKTFFGDNWPNRAQYWLPVIDHPSDKATVEFHITAPHHYDVIASGKLMSKSTLADSRNLFHYKTYVPLSTKIMVFAAADFQTKNYEIVKDIIVSSWIFKEEPKVGLDDYKDAVDALKYYDSLIGPYSYEKLANVQSKTRFGGMENAGNIFYYEESITGNQTVEALVAHEVAHQWFGNSVSEENWSDIWLSEGFATYLTDLYLENKYGEEKLIERMEMEREKVLKYFNTDQSKSIVYIEKENLFKLLNRNSYEKGAWVLHMLRAKVGYKTFFKILREYYASYKNTNANTAEFIALAERVSQQNLQIFFNQWLYKSGIPKVKISYTIKKRCIKFTVEQKSDVYNLDLPIKVQNGSKEQNLVLSLQKQTQKFRFKNKLKSIEIEVIVDPDVQVLFESY